MLLGDVPTDINYEVFPASSQLTLVICTHLDKSYDLIRHILITGNINCEIEKHK